MKRLLIGFIVILVSQPLSALLPPFYQSTKEIIAILSSPLISEKIGSPYPIQSITKSENGYTIVVADCQLEVKIIYLPRTDGMVGPAEFKIELGEKTCQ